MQFENYYKCLDYILEPTNANTHTVISSSHKPHVEIVAA